MARVRQIESVVTGLDHPECVSFGPDGAGYAGGERGQIYRFDLEGDLQTIGFIDGGAGGLCLDGLGNVYVCNARRSRVERVSQSGATEVYSSGSVGTPLVLPNFPVLDRHGNLFFSESGSLYEATGRIFVVDSSGATRVLTAGLAFPNGLAIDPDGRHLLVIESTASRIMRYRLDNGLIRSPELFATLPNTFPDGMAFTTGGALYVGCYIPDLICRIGRGGEIEEVARDPFGDKLNRPTNVAFIPGTTRLAIANFGGDTISVMDVGEEGRPLYWP